MDQQRAMNLSALRYSVYFNVLEVIREFLEGSKKANTQDTTCSQAPQRKSKGNNHPRCWLHKWPESMLSLTLEVTDIIALANPDKEEERDALPKFLGKVLDRIRNLSFFPASTAVGVPLLVGQMRAWSDRCLQTFSLLL